MVVAVSIIVGATHAPLFLHFSASLGLSKSQVLVPIALFSSEIISESIQR